MQNDMWRVTSAGDANNADTENVENLSETPKEENRDDSDQ